MNNIAFSTAFVNDIFISNKCKRIVPIEDIPPAEILFGAKNTLIETASKKHPTIIRI